MELELDIAEIKVGHRKRKLNEEKIESLVESYKRIGQLQPVTVIKDNGMYKLLAGLHRLEAAKRSGWQLIKASLFEGDDIAAELAEIDENLMRNDLTVLEQGEHLARRQELIGYKQGDNRFTVGRGEIISPLKSTPELAKEIGLTERSAQNRMQVARNIVPEVKDTIRNTEIANSTTQLLELARLAPEEQVEVAKKVADGAFSIAESLKKIAKDKREEMHSEKRSRALPEGKFSVIYADPPWQYDNSGLNTSAENQYPTMPIEQICELPINKLTEETSVLFLWATNPLLPEALRVIDAWGFSYKTNLVWIKGTGAGIGWFEKSAHEILIIAVKKNTPHPALRPVSYFEEFRTVHSRKPERAYEIIESMYPGNKIELFSRNNREGWEAWGNEE